MKIKKPKINVSTQTVPVFNCCIMNNSANAVLMSNVIVVFVLFLFIYGFILVYVGVIVNMILLFIYI